MGRRPIVTFVVFSLAALTGCSPKAPPPAGPVVQSTPPKAPKRPFAGTTNVPPRRHVRGEEMTREIAQRAREILDANRDAAFGTEVPFDVDGHAYVGRIEEHYHEPGGPKKPWGRHRGVTVYHAE